MNDLEIISSQYFQLSKLTTLTIQIIIHPQNAHQMTTSKISHIQFFSYSL